jgi:hypothetical protein
MQHQIYFCNIQIKHMQYTYEMHETYGCNICSSTCFPPMDARWHGGWCQHWTRGHPRSTGGWIATTAGGTRCGARSARHGRCVAQGTGEASQRKAWDVGARGARHGGTRVGPIRKELVPLRVSWFNLRHTCMPSGLTLVGRDRGNGRIDPRGPFLSIREAQERVQSLRVSICVQGNVRSIFHCSTGIDTDTALRLFIICRIFI